MSDVTPSARLFRILWLAMGGSALVLLGVLGWLGVAQEPPMPEAAEAAFYGVALLSAAATLGAFWVLRTMEQRLLQAETEPQALALVQTWGIVALAVAEVPVIAAGVAAFLTGDVLVLALAVPFFAFLALTWPSDGRVAYWAALGTGVRPGAPLDA